MYVVFLISEYLSFVVSDTGEVAVCSVTSSHPSVKQVFKDMEFLGWYTTGGPPDQSDIHIHKQVA